MTEYLVLYIANGKLTLECMSHKNAKWQQARRNYLTTFHGDIRHEQLTSYLETYKYQMGLELVDKRFEEAS